MKGAKDSKDGGVKDSYVSADSMLTSFLYHLIRHLSLTLSIPSLFDQNANVANKETEVKSLGVKGGKDSKDSGVVESYVSANKYAAIISLSSHQASLIDFSIPSLCDQCNANVANETEVKSLGVKGVKDSKDGGYLESYVSANKYADIISLSSHQASLIDFINPFSL